jgi:hypothetical protein
MTRAKFLGDRRIGQTHVWQRPTTPKQLHISKRASVCGPTGGLIFHASSTSSRRQPFVRFVGKLGMEGRFCGIAATMSSQSATVGRSLLERTLDQRRWHGHHRRLVRE